MGNHHCCERCAEEKPIEIAPCCEPPHNELQKAAKVELLKTQAEEAQIRAEEARIRKQLQDILEKQKKIERDIKDIQSNKEEHEVCQQDSMSAWLTSGWCGRKTDLPRKGTPLTNDQIKSIEATLVQMQRKYGHNHRQNNLHAVRPDSPVSQRESPTKQRAKTGGPDAREKVPSAYGESYYIS